MHRAQHAGGVDAEAGVRFKAVGDAFCSRVVTNLAQMLVERFPL